MFPHLLVLCIQALDSETCRRRRGDAGIEIRKQKREENLAKRRFLSAQALGTTIPAGSDGGVSTVAVAGSGVGGQGQVVSQGGKPAPPRVDDIPK